MHKDRIDDEIHAERMRQEKRFGEQNHDPFIYGSILFEECGEVSKAVNDAHDWDNPGNYSRAGLSALRIELIQTAAVAKAFIECLDRKVISLNRADGID